MTLHIIVASEIGSDIHERVHLIIENEANLQYVSHKEEVYWKDGSMLNIDYEINAKKAVSEKEWIELFDRYLKHHDTNRNDTFLEIDHYSEFGNRNEPFVIAYIPTEFVTD